MRNTVHCPARSPDWLERYGLARQAFGRSRMLARNAIVVLLLICCLIASATAQDRSFASRHRASPGLLDLGIALFLRGEFQVIDFAGHVRSENSRFYFTVSSFGSDGTRVVGLAGSMLTVLDRSIQLLWQRPSPVRSVLNLSLAPDASEIAVVELGR